MFSRSLKGQQTDMSATCWEESQLIAIDVIGFITFWLYLVENTEKQANEDGL